MTIKTGVDLVYLPRFRKSLESGGTSFLQRVYVPQELVDQSPTHLAGIFAAKEAVIKTLGLPADSWHSIQVSHNLSGAPHVKFQPPISHLTHHSLSISHDGNYVIAQFTALVQDK